jgi:hypothetical protein
MQDERHHLSKSKGTVLLAILILVMTTFVFVSNVTAAPESQNLETPSGLGQYGQTGLAPDTNSPLRGDILGSGSLADLPNHTPSDSVPPPSEKSATGEAGTASQSGDLSEPFFGAVEEPLPVQVDNNADHTARNAGLLGRGSGHHGRDRSTGRVSFLPKEEMLVLVLKLKRNTVKLS